MQARVADDLGEGEEREEEEDETDDSVKKGISQSSPASTVEERGTRMPFALVQRGPGVIGEREW